MFANGAEGSRNKRYRDVFLAAKPLRDIPEEKRQKFDAIAIGGPTSVHLLDYKV